jgi:hypothetical protein
VLVNLAYFRGLGFDAVVRSDAVAADLLKRVWGEFGEKLISIMIAIAALTSVNGSIIVGFHDHRHAHSAIAVRIRPLCQ